MFSGQVQEPTGAIPNEPELRLSVPVPIAHDGHIARQAAEVNEGIGLGGIRIVEPPVAIGIQRPESVAVDANLVSFFRCHSNGRRPPGSWLLRRSESAAWRSRKWLRKLQEAKTAAWRVESRILTRAWESKMEMPDFSGS